MSNQIHVTVEVYDNQADCAIARSSVTKTIQPANASEDTTDMYILLEEGTKSIADECGEEVVAQLEQMQRLHAPEHA